MEQRICILITARDTLEELNGVLTLMGVAVTARPLTEHESDGIDTILRWAGNKVSECSQELAKLIDHTGKSSET